MNETVCVMEVWLPRGCASARCDLRSLISSIKTDEPSCHIELRGKADRQSKLSEAHNVQQLLNRYAAHRVERAKLNSQYSAPEEAQTKASKRVCWQSLSLRAVVITEEIQTSQILPVTICDKAKQSALGRATST